MNKVMKTQMFEIPIAGNHGLVWNRLHSERADICEEMIKDSKQASTRNSTTARWHRELLQERMRRIDAALDRLMSGSYGHCSNCGRSIEAEKLEIDGTTGFCSGCEPAAHDPGHTDRPHAAEAFPAELVLDQTHPFETIVVKTLNSEYRIWLLDPKTGKAVVDGGPYLAEPRPATLSGSTLDGCSFKPGTIVVGRHLEMIADGKILRTSRIISVNIKPPVRGRAADFHRGDSAVQSSRRLQLA
jgi:RNA polymerase-binding transcription factor DksA